MDKRKAAALVKKNSGKMFILTSCGQTYSRQLYVDDKECIFFRVSGKMGLEFHLYPDLEKTEIRLAG